MDIRLQAQLAASWYFTQLDPYSPNHENIQQYLRAPLIALTAQAFVAKKEIGANSVPGAKVEENGRFLKAQDFEKVQWEKNDTQQDESNGLRHVYDNLSRRTKIRMEAVLASCALAVPIEAVQTSPAGENSEPSDLVSLQEGLSGLSGFVPKQAHRHEKTAVPMRSITARTKSVQKHPQIQEDDLVMRLDIYMRTVQRVVNLKEDCVIAMEPPRIIKARAFIITNAFVATTGTIRNLRHVLTRLLNCLTMETLAVEVLSEDVTKVIRRIVSEYEHGTSFASLAFLSTPEVSAGSLLTPLSVRYLRYLQNNWEQLVRNCDLERMLKRAIDPELRKTFKEMEFRSIGHLLEICNEHRAKLQDIQLSPNTCALAENINSLIHSKDALRQALRDLQREVITVNGHVLPPVRSKKGLLKLLNQTLNSKTVTVAEKLKLSFKNEKSAAPKSDTSETPKTPAEAGTQKKGQREPKNDDSDYLFSSEADSGMSDAHDDSSHSENKSSEAQRSRGVRRRNFHVSTIDLLTRRLLIAASRTGNGGDAYFIIRDLFGGEDVEVIPVAVPPPHGRKLHPGTIDILVRLASVTIKCHQSFDVYPKSWVGECEPLVQFHTTTTETIPLQEVRSPGEPDVARNTDELSTDTSLLMLQERTTTNAGWRTISVRPAAYEKIAVWGTPS